MPTTPGGASAREPSISAGKFGALASSDPTHQQTSLHLYNAAVLSPRPANTTERVSINVILLTVDHNMSLSAGKALMH